MDEYKSKDGDEDDCRPVFKLLAEEKR